jgi:selT/selW/selH-like putative selenoprotein
LPQATSLVEEIRLSFPEEKFEFELRKGEGGIFKIEVDEKVLFNKKNAGRWPVYREIPERLNELFANTKKA